MGGNNSNTGPSENILWSNSNIQMWSISKDWKTGYVIKTGPTQEKHPYKRSTIKDKKSNYGNPLNLLKRSSKIRETFVSNPQLNMM